MKYTLHVPINGPGCTVMIDGEKHHLVPGGSAILSASEVELAKKTAPNAKVRPIVEPKRVEAPKPEPKPTKTVDMIRPEKKEKKGGKTDSPSTH